MAANGIAPKSIIVVQKPFMERRSYATIMKQWPEVDRPMIKIASPNISFEEYPDEHVTCVAKYSSIFLFVDSH